MKLSKGFTLIELLVVVAIIGVLSSVVLASLNVARSKARDTKRLAEIRQLQTALEFYYDKNGRYPRSSGGCGTSKPEGPNPSWCNSVQSLSGDHWIRNGGTKDALAPFLPSDPKDPSQGAESNWTPRNGGTYFYYANGYGGTGQWYMIVFGLENPNPSIEAIDGVTACNGRYFHYGNGSNGILTVGGDCTF